MAINRNAILDALKGGDVGATVDQLLAASGVPEMPADLAARARELTEVELLMLTSDILMETTMTLVAIGKDLSKRCRLCHDQANGQPCGPCTGVSLKLQEVFATMAGLARTTQCATAPGSRIAAQSEARSDKTLVE